MSLGEAIRLLRKKALYTQEDFAVELNVSLSTVNRWEQGKAKPNTKAMKSIKAFCNSRSIPFDDIEKAWLAASSKWERHWG